MLSDDNNQFRVSQRQGFDRYGKSTSINQIVALTETQYEEKPICVVTPDFAPGVLGTHHLHSNGKITVFDFGAFAVP